MLTPSRVTCFEAGDQVDAQIVKPDNELLQALIGMRASYLVNVAEARAQHMCRCADALLPHYHMTLCVCEP